MGKGHHRGTARVAMVADVGIYCPCSPTSGFGRLCLKAAPTKDFSSVFHGGLGLAQREAPAKGRIKFIKMVEYPPAYG